MGANYIDRTYPGTMTSDALRAAVDADRDNDGYNDGYGGYSGTWTECNGLDIRDDVYPVRTDADVALQDVCEKWGPLVAVRVRGTAVVDTPDVLAARRALSWDIPTDNATARADAVNVAITARKGKGRYVTCRPCGSRIALAHIRGDKCPVCRADGLILTKTQDARLTRDADAAIAAGNRALKDAVQKAGGRPVDIWVVGGICSS